MHRVWRESSPGRVGPHRSRRPSRSASRCSSPQARSPTRLPVARRSRASPRRRRRSRRLRDLERRPREPHGDVEVAAVLGDRHQDVHRDPGRQREHLCGGGRGRRLRPARPRDGDRQEPRLRIRSASARRRHPSSSRRLHRLRRSPLRPSPSPSLRTSRTTRPEPSTRRGSHGRHPAASRGRPARHEPVPRRPHQRPADRVGSRRQAALGARAARREDQRALPRRLLPRADVARAASEGQRLSFASAICGRARSWTSLCASPAGSASGRRSRSGAVPRRSGSIAARTRAGTAGGLSGGMSGAGEQARTPDGGCLARAGGQRGGAVRGGVRGHGGVR